MLFGYGIPCGACGDGCDGKACQVKRDSPPIPATRVLSATVDVATGHIEINVQFEAPQPPATVIQPRHVDFLG